MFTLLRRRDFTLVWTAGLASDAASWVLITGLPIFVFTLTDSSFVTSTVFVVELVSGITLGSFAGVLIDRCNRFRLMTVITLLQAATLLLLLCDPAHHLWIIYLVAATQAVLTQTFEPAKNAILPGLVEPDQIVRANSMVAFNTSLGRLFGSSLGGFAVVHNGMVALCLGAGLCFLGAGVLIEAARRASATVRVPPTSERTTTPFVRAWRDGLRLVVDHKDVRVAFLSTATWSVAQGLFVVLFIVFVSRVLHDSGTVTGVLRGVQAIGGLIGGVVVAAVGSRLGPRKLMVIGSSSFGLLSLAIWNAPHLTQAEPVYVMLFIAVGVPGIASNSGVYSLLQQSVPGHELGRVFGIFYTVNNGFQCIGMAVGGLLGDHLDVTHVLDGQAALYLVAAAISYLGISRLRPTSTHNEQKAVITSTSSSEHHL
jgi:MFS family permease